MSQPNRFEIGARSSTELTPRYKPVGSGPDFWRVICPCNGLVAEIDRAMVGPGRMIKLYHRGFVDFGLQAARADAEPAPQAWIVTRPGGLRRDDSGRYHAIKDVGASHSRWGPRRHIAGGRRRIDGGPPAAVALKGWAVVGEFPTLPATIFCGECKRPCRVLPPA